MMHDWQGYVRDRARRHPRYGVWVRRVEGQPPWVVKAAAAVMVLVVVVPLVLLTLAAVTAGLIAFAVLGAVAAVVVLIRRALGPRETLPDDGRRNVRVIDPLRR